MPLGALQPSGKCEIGKHIVFCHATRSVQSSRLLDWSKLVVRNMTAWHPEIAQHLVASFYHHRWPAQVIFNRLGVLVLDEIFVAYNLMDEPGRPRPVVFRQRRRERHPKTKIRVLPRKLKDIVVVVELLTRACPIPEGDLPMCSFGLEQVGK